MALSFWQPWAEAILSCGKEIENRTWPTSYRGRLIIHAAKKFDRAAWASCQMILRRLGYPLLLPQKVRFGCLIGEVEVYGCLQIGAEQTSGPWSFGPWCWLLRNPQKWDKPIPWKGSQGFFKVNLP